MEPSVFTKYMVSYDTGHFSLKRYYGIWFLRGFSVMLLLLKAVWHLCTENIAGVAQGNIFNEIVTHHMERFLMPIKHRFELRNSGMQYYYFWVELLIQRQDNQPEQKHHFPGIIWHHLLFKKWRIHPVEEDGSYDTVKPFFKYQYLSIPCRVMIS